MPTEESFDAFILFNQKDHDAVEKIVHGLTTRGITTYFWDRDIPIGAEWRNLESKKLRQARTVVVFLGKEGWGNIHLQLAHEAEELGKSILPVLIGNPRDEELSEINGLFRRLRHLPMQRITEEALDTLADQIRRQQGSTPALAGQGQGPEKPPAAAPARLEDFSLDPIIQTLVDGSEEKRTDVLEEIISLSGEKRASLGRRLRREIQERFSPANERTDRSSSKVPSIRSWMLSSLIWADADSEESSACILDHLRKSIEPELTVRFWVLAGLYQRKVPYLQDAAQVCLRDDDLEAQDAVLAKAILSRDDPEFATTLKSKLTSPDFEAVLVPLRVLRIIPIPELVEDVCGLLEQDKGDASVAYDALYALANPTMAREAAQVLPRRPGINALVKLVLQVLRHSDQNAARNFTPILYLLDEQEIGRALDEGTKNPETKLSAELLSLRLEEFRARLRNRKLDPSPQPFSPSIPRISSDSVPYGNAPNEQVDDALQVGVYANHLAQLIAAKTTPMPLSIGLFGQWGSGKSHFIRLIHDGLDKLTDRNGTAFHKNIVHIHFNAWHYLDTSLWANLVCEIFDQLFARLSDKEDVTEDQLKNLRKKVGKLSALAVVAKEELEAAKTARIKAESDLKEAKLKRIQEENSLRGMLDSVAVLVGEDKDLKKELKSLSAQMGLPALELSFSELEARAKEMRSFQGRAQALTVAIFTGPGGWIRICILGVVLMLPALIEYLSVAGPEIIRQSLQGVVALIAQVATAVGGLTVLLSSHLKAGNTVLSHLGDAYEKVKKAREKVEETGDAARAQTALRGRRQAEEEAEENLREIELKIQALNSEIAELGPGRQLIRFLHERTSAEGYRRHLGLVSLIRKDFQQLSDLLLKASEGNDKDLPQIDRIVLYIDDLDRCRTDRVVEVLEAVHLLLAFRLFAVVVAVDPRWLRQSLLEHYAKLLGTPAADANPPVETSQRRATPQDYLEKIFQVPFNLQAIDRPGFTRLINSLFAIGKIHEEPTTGEEKKASPTEKGPDGVVEVKPGPQPDAQSSEQREEVLKEEVIGHDSGAEPLFQSPRAVKRFANTYSLIRVGVEKAFTRLIGLFDIGKTHEESTQTHSRLPIATDEEKKPSPTEKGSDGVLQKKRPESQHDVQSPEQDKDAPKVNMVAPAPGAEPHAQEVDPKRFELSPRELADVYRLQPLFQTPRAVKRFANTYSLIRVGVDKAEWSEFIGGEYRTPMLLLAVAAACPALAQSWLLWLCEDRKVELTISAAEITALVARNHSVATADWHALTQSLNEIARDEWSLPERSSILKWVPRVVRYSF